MYRAMPEYFGNQKIRFRVPWTMPGELVLEPAVTNFAFPPATFQLTTDKPFEIWDILPRASQSVAAVPFIPIAEPAPGINKFWRLRIRALSINEEITNGAQLVDSMVDRDTGNWALMSPFTIERAQGFVIAVDNLIAAGGNRLRAEITLRGYLLVVPPASAPR